MDSSFIAEHVAGALVSGLVLGVVLWVLDLLTH